MPAARRGAGTCGCGTMPTGTPEDAAIALDFDALAGGWGDGRSGLGGRHRPDVRVAGAAGLRPASDAPLAAPAEGWVELSGIACDGSGSVLAIGDVLVPEHRLRIATGYDDLYHLTPARVLRNTLQLGYRGAIDHYVGMSHYFRLDARRRLARQPPAEC